MAKTEGSSHKGRGKAPFLRIDRWLWITTTLALRVVGVVRLALRLKVRYGAA